MLTTTDALLIIPLLFIELLKWCCFIEFKMPNTTSTNVRKSTTQMTAPP